MQALFPVLRKAAAALSAQLALTFFVPLCLTGLAIVSRLHVSSFSCADHSWWLSTTRPTLVICFDCMRSS